MSDRSWPAGHGLAPHAAWRQLTSLRGDTTGVSPWAHVGRLSCGWPRSSAPPVHAVSEMLGPAGGTSAVGRLTTSVARTTAAAATAAIAAKPPHRLRVMARSAASSRSRSACHSAAVSVCAASSASARGSPEESRSALPTPIRSCGPRWRDWWSHRPGGCRAVGDLRLGQIEEVARTTIAGAGRLIASDRPRAPCRCPGSRRRRARHREEAARRGVHPAIEVGDRARDPRCSSGRATRRSAVRGSGRRGAEPTRGVRGQRRRARAEVGNLAPCSTPAPPLASPA